MDISLAQTGNFIDGAFRPAESGATADTAAAADAAEPARPAAAQED